MTDPLLLANAEIVDLTQPIGPTTATWPGDGPVEVAATADVRDDGFFARRITLPEHVGTHVDAPAHVLADGATVDDLAPRLLVRPVAVVDAREAVGDDRDAVVGVDVVVASEARHGPIARGDVVIVRTGWDRHVADADAYIGSGTARCPGLDVPAARHLIDRGVAGIGIDTLSVEAGQDEDLPVHRLTLGAGVWHVEGLVCVDCLPARGAWIVVAPLRLAGGSGAPARVLAFAPRGGAS